MTTQQVIDAVKAHSPRLNDDGQTCRIVYDNGYPDAILAAKIELHRSAVIEALGGSRRPRNDGRGAGWEREED